MTAEETSYETINLLQSTKAGPEIQNQLRPDKRRLLKDRAAIAINLKTAVGRR
jgi:hypothetical protein